MKERIQKIFSKRVVGILNLILILVLLAGFVYYINFGEMVNALLTASLPWFFASVMIRVIWNLFNSIKLWILLRKQEILVPLPKLMVVNMGFRFYSFFAPISSVGTVMRFQRLIPLEKAAEGIAAFSANRIFEILMIIVVGVFWGVSALNQQLLNPYIFLAYLLAFILLLALSFRVSDFIVAWAEKKQDDTHSPRMRWVYRATVKFFRAFSIYRSLSLTEIAVLFGIAIVGELIGLVSYIVIAFSLNMPISFTDLGWIRALMLLSSFVLPVTLPGGFGLREASGIAILTGLGVNTEQAAAFSLLLYVRSVLIALLGGAMELAVNFRAAVGRAAEH